MAQKFQRQASLSVAQAQRAAQREVDRAEFVRALSAIQERDEVSSLDDEEESDEDPERLPSALKKTYSVTLKLPKGLIPSHDSTEEGMIQFAAHTSNHGHSVIQARITELKSKSEVKLGSKLGQPSHLDRPPHPAQKPKRQQPKKINKGTSNVLHPSLPMLSIQASPYAIRPQHARGFIK